MLEGCTVAMTQRAQADSTSCPRYSPDGQQIAFQAVRDGREEVFVCQADGSNPTRLTGEDGGQVSGSVGDAQ
jgi:Tol biopolymer transport system component